MKITQSRNKREGRWVVKYDGRHWRGSFSVDKVAYKPLSRKIRKEIQRQNRTWSNCPWVSP